MKVFEVVEEMPKDGSIRGLTAEIVDEVKKAIEDGKVRAMPLTKETEKVAGTVKRYVATQGFSTKVRKTADRIYWQVVEKKELDPAHLERMQAALRNYRDSKATTNGQTPAPEAPTASEPPAPTEVGKGNRRGGTAA